MMGQRTINLGQILTAISNYSDVYTKAPLSKNGVPVKRCFYKIVLDNAIGTVLDNTQY